MGFGDWQAISSSVGVDKKSRTYITIIQNYESLH
jgi:hypothetical protein